MKPRFSLRSLFAVLTIFAILCATLAFVGRYVGREERVFSSVKVGDTEQRLIQLLEGNSIAYRTDDAGAYILYSHGDGVGLCFYYVKDAKVVGTALD